MIKAKSIKALEAQVGSDILTDIAKIGLGWIFGNEEETWHLIIDVPWFIEFEEYCESQKAKEVSNILDETFGDKWREMRLLYLIGPS